MQNFQLLKAVGKMHKPVLLKRGLANTIEEWIMLSLIHILLACGYESRKVMMVGDAMGDAQAAAANGVALENLYPFRQAGT